ncbi:uncharacterized protein BJ171DRAFT_515233 [Polychytrium aggregatum]|uniref:uncharacterized protein n=1 Tax=Polychytrium aggregatum TaxID=110093 RepID=UPI0022FDD357|nr:uncharacterized protein BJ171DRAFT_515233 [Polychytrium aggregatum]KAI9202227.1 hypothetical protein BJ171DRAFT_515233 [Polychytrium aggregatum]
MAVSLSLLRNPAPFLRHNIGPILSVLAVMIFVAVEIVVAYNSNFALPAPLDASVPNSTFSEARARVLLQNLTVDIGIHNAGGPKHYLARELLNSSLLAILNQPTVPGVRVEISQLGDNSTLGNYSYLYPNFTTTPPENIYIRLSDASSPVTQNKSTLLLSAHYDSVPTGPGATDDGVGTVALVETVRNLLSKQRLDLAKWNVLVILFDQEEIGLIGSAWFMHHPSPWQLDTKLTNVILNIEGSGSAGKFTLVRGSSQWAVNLFAQSAPRPYGLSVVQFIYNHVFLGGSTDLDSILRSSPIHAVELIAVHNRFRYHTIDDSYANVQQGSIQHLGENIAAFTDKVLSTDPASYPPMLPIISLEGVPRSIPTELYYYTSFFDSILVTQSRLGQILITTASIAVVVPLLGAFGSIFKARMCIGARSVGRVALDALINAGLLLAKALGSIVLTSVVSLSIVLHSKNWTAPPENAFRLLFFELSVAVACRTNTAEQTATAEQRKSARHDLFVSLPKKSLVEAVSSIEDSEPNGPVVHPTAPRFAYGYANFVEVAGLALFNMLLGIAMTVVLPDLFLIPTINVVVAAIVVLVDFAYLTMADKMAGSSGANSVDTTGTESSESGRALISSRPDKDRLSLVYFALRQMLILSPLLAALQTSVMVSTALPYYLNAMDIPWASGILVGLFNAMFVMPNFDPLVQSLKTHQGLGMVPVLAVYVCVAVTTIALAYSSST